MPMNELMCDLATRKEEQEGNRRKEKGYAALC